MEKLLSGADYNQLRAFVAVAQALSFTRAARQLRVTPSALSQTIRGLEESIGLALLHRTTRSVALTIAGQNLFLRAQPAIVELADAVHQARSAGNRPAGTVRVHAFRSASERYIEPLLAKFRETYPEIVLDITLDDSVVDVVSGGFDVSLRVGEVIQKDMIAVRLGPDLRQLAVASPAYLKRHEVPAHPRDLLDHACVQWRWPGQTQPYAWEFFEDGRWFEVAVTGPMIVNDKQLLVQAAVQGVGIAFCVEDSVTEDLAAGRLVSLLEAWSEPFPGIFLCYPQQRQMAPALRAFIDAVRKEADRLR